MAIPVAVWAIGGMLGSGWLISLTADTAQQVGNSAEEVGNSFSVINIALLLLIAAYVIWKWG